nr:hypothetical protein [Simkaniaceae bacterium]
MSINPVSGTSPIFPTDSSTPPLKLISNALNAVLTQAEQTITSMGGGGDHLAFKLGGSFGVFSPIL